jgi:hypothetical protein
MLPVILLVGLGFQGAPSANVGTDVSLFSSCDTSSEVIASVPRDAAFEVHYSIDNEPTCYLVTLALPGRTVRGYVFERKLNAVAEFEKSRLEAARYAFSLPIPLPPSAAPPPAPKDSEKPKTDPAKTEVAKAKPSKANPKVSW